MMAENAKDIALRELYAERSHQVEKDWTLQERYHFIATGERPNPIPAWFIWPMALGAMIAAGFLILSYLGLLA